MKNNPLIKYVSGNSIPVERTSITVKELKTTCIKFFYYCHNNPGINTEQCFEEWFNNNNTQNTKNV